MDSIVGLIIGVFIGFMLGIVVCSITEEPNRRI